MAIRAVLWDLGGVIVRTEDYTRRDALANRLGLSRYELEEIVFGRENGRKAQLGEISFQRHWEGLCQVFGLPVEEIAHLQDEFWGGDVVDVGLLAYIRGLRTAYKTGLISNAFSDLRQMIHENWDFADAFDQMVVSAEEGIMKPDAAIYRIALDRLGVQPGEAVFIDDMQHNIIGAQAVGMYGVQFKDREQVLRDLDVLLEVNHR